MAGFGCPPRIVDLPVAVEIGLRAAVPVGEQAWRWHLVARVHGVLQILGEKGTDDGQIVRHRRRTDATLVDEEAFIRSFDSLDRSVAARTGNGGSDDAAAAQAAQQLPAGRCLATPPAVRPASEEERLDPLLVESLDAKLLALEPTAEVPDESVDSTAQRAGAQSLLAL